MSWARSARSTGVLNTTERGSSNIASTTHSARGQFDFAERPQFNNFDPAYQGVGHLADRPQPRRAGEHESPWPTAGIDGSFHRAEQARFPLRLVDDEGVDRPLRETPWVLPACVERVFAVEADGLHRPSKLQQICRQRRLSDLAGAVDDDHRGVGEGLSNARNNESIGDRQSRRKAECTG